MGMRYAGFMAAAREDRLTREQREEEDKIREQSYQRQIERDEAAHQRQLELLDIRQKNALRLSGIAAAKAQKKKDAALKRQVDAIILTQNLPDTPKVRAELAAGLEIYDPKTFLSDIANGRTRINSTGAPSSPSTEVPEFPVGETVGPDIEAPRVDMTTSEATNPSIRLSTQGAATEASEPTDSQMSDLDLARRNDAMEAAPAEAPSVEPQPSMNIDPQTEFALGTPVTEEEPAEDGPVISYGNNPYIKLEDYAGLDAMQLEQQIRMLSSKGYTDEELKPLRSELEYVKKTEQDKEEDFTDLIGGADSFGKLNSLQGSLDAQLAEGKIDQDEFDNRSGLIVKATERLIDINRQNAEKDGGQLMYFPFTSTGMVGSDGQLVTVRDGQYIDAQGNPIDVSGGRLLPPDGYETFIRNYNNSAQKIATDIDQGVGAVQAISDYRQMVIESPQGLNTYISVAGRLVSEANSIKSAFEGVVNGEYSYTTFENNVMSSIRDLSADDRRIARAQLRTAYAMAAFSGSTGQALSDRELMMNLENIGQGITDPKKVVGLLNDAMSEVVTRTEQKRSTKFNSFIATEDLKQTMSDTPIGMDFQSYLYNRENPIIDDRTLINVDDALKGQTDYAYKAVEDVASGNYTLDDIPNMTFQQFQEFLKGQPYDPANPDSGSVYDQYSEDELREYFTKNGGKL
jgi:hypothetical protein